MAHDSTRSHCYYLLICPAVLHFLMGIASEKQAPITFLHAYLSLWGWFPITTKTVIWIWLIGSIYVQRVMKGKHLSLQCMAQYEPRWKGASNSLMFVKGWRGSGLTTSGIFWELFEMRMKTMGGSRIWKALKAMQRIWILLSRCLKVTLRQIKTTVFKKFGVARMCSMK